MRHLRASLRPAASLSNTKRETASAQGIYPSFYLHPQLSIIYYLSTRVSSTKRCISFGKNIVSFFSSARFNKLLKSLLWHLAIMILIRECVIAHNTLEYVTFHKPSHHLPNPGHLSPQPNFEPQQWTFELGACVGGCLRLSSAHSGTHS